MLHCSLQSLEEDKSEAVKHRMTLTLVGAKLNVECCADAMF
jgi:hypothetical protein